MPGFQLQLAETCVCPFHSGCLCLVPILLLHIPTPPVLLHVLTSKNIFSLHELLSNSFFTAPAFLLCASVSHFCSSTIQLSNFFFPFSDFVLNFILFKSFINFVVPSAVNLPSKPLGFYCQLYIYFTDPSCF